MTNPAQSEMVDADGLDIIEALVADASAIEGVANVHEGSSYYAERLIRRAIEQGNLAVTGPANHPAHRSLPEPQQDVVEELNQRATLIVELLAIISQHGLPAKRTLINRAKRVIDGNSEGEANYRAYCLADPEHKPDGTLEALTQCARMLEEYGPDCFPANESGQVHFARAMMDATAVEIRAFAQAMQVPELPKWGAAMTKFVHAVWWGDNASFSIVHTDNPRCADDVFDDRVKALEFVVERLIAGRELHNEQLRIARRQLATERRIQEMERKA